jgi:hypothetical protein
MNKMQEGMQLRFVLDCDCSEEVTPASPHGVSARQTQCEEGRPVVLYMVHYVAKELQGQLGNREWHLLPTTSEREDQSSPKGLKELQKQ